MQRCVFPLDQLHDCRCEELFVLRSPLEMEVEFMTQCRNSLRSLLLILIGVALSPDVQVASAESPAPKWWKGNLHTHSLWSDGDQFPEMIADWYENHGYHFLAMTDHNVLSEGGRWMSVTKVVERSHPEILADYQERFGDEWVETREDSEGELEVRLKPLNEFRHLLEKSAQFLMIPAEEISDRAAGKPVHINATNLAEAIRPVGGDTVREAIQNNLRAILEHEQRHGREVLPHLNHPNFHYAVTADDLAHAVSERFFEVYNGHPGVNQLGDSDHPSIERMWDLINAIRRTDLNAPLMMGVATDDSHDYHDEKGSRPGRGWVMVRSRYLTPEHLIRAMKRGDFYASSGVTLNDVAFDRSSQTIRISISGVAGQTYQTQFVATLKDHKTADENAVGTVLKTSEDLECSYTMTGNELYVRAVVTSSEAHADPSYGGQRKQAWTQPVSVDAP